MSFSLLRTYHVAVKFECLKVTLFNVESMFKLNNKKLVKIVGQSYVDILKEDKPLLRKDDQGGIQNDAVLPCKKKVVKKICTNSK